MKSRAEKIAELMQRLNEQSGIRSEKEKIKELLRRLNDEEYERY